MRLDALQPDVPSSSPEDLSEVGSQFRCQRNARFRDSIDCHRNSQVVSWKFFRKREEKWDDSSDGSIASLICMA